MQDDDNRELPPMSVADVKRHDAKMKKMKAKMKKMKATIKKKKATIKKKNAEIEQLKHNHAWELAHSVAEEKERLYKFHKMVHSYYKKHGVNLLVIQRKHLGTGTFNVRKPYSAEKAKREFIRSRARAASKSEQAAAAGTATPATATAATATAVISSG